MILNAKKGEIVPISPFFAFKIAQVDFALIKSRTGFRSLNSGEPMKRERDYRVRWKREKPSSISPLPVGRFDGFLSVQLSAVYHEDRAQTPISWRIDSLNSTIDSLSHCSISFFTIPMHASLSSSMAAFRVSIQYWSSVSINSALNIRLFSPLGTSLKILSSNLNNNLGVSDLISSFSPKKVSESLCVEGCVFGRLSDVSMAQVILNISCRSFVVGQLVATRMAKHVGVDFEYQACFLANHFKQVVDRLSSHRAALAQEQQRRA